MRILIIAGHGGTPYDSGATGNGFQEAKLTREVANLLFTELKNVKTVTPVMFDQSKDAYKVVRAGGSLPLSGIDYVLEIHFNALNGKAYGTEVLVKSNETGVGTETAICKYMAQLGFTNRGIKRRDDLAVMNTVKRNGISPALVEVCFIDSKKDIDIYTKNKVNVAKAIAKGVAEGFSLEYTDGEDDMTVEEVKKIIEDNKVVYNTINEVPDYGKETVQKLVDKGFLKGDTKGLALTEDMLRIFVVNDRAGFYD